MSYDFFNTSLLAFGKKLTAAFKSLNDLSKAARDNVDQVLQDLRIFNQYGNKNYKIPVPLSGDRPCRTDEVYNLIGQPVYFKQIEYDGETLRVSGIKFNKSTKRVTHFSGSTEIISGSCYYTEGISNTTTGATLRFYSESSSGNRVGLKLFNYDIDTDNNKVIILDDISNLNMTTL